MAIPILFTHWGNSDYLKYSLHQARHFNSESEIYLLGDDKNNKYKIAKHFQISDYSKSAIHFEKLYVHLNTTIHKNGVLNWFKRWFIVNDFLSENPHIHSFICLDSDVLLYTNVTEEFDNYKQHNLTLCGERGPQYTFFSSPESLKSFCRYIESLYADKELFKILKDKFEHHERMQIPGGVDDMTAFYEYSKKNSTSIGNTNTIINNATFDHCINAADGFEFNNKLGIKQIYWRGNIPYGKLIQNGEFVRFKALHFQGTEKSLMHNFYRGNGLGLSKLKSDIYNHLLLPIRKILNPNE